MRKRSNLKTKRNLALLLALLIYSEQLFAQLRISGKITDQKGGPVAGTTILFKNSTAGTASAADGSYQLSANFKNGDQHLVFSHIGFKTEERVITVTGSGPLALDITLTEDVTGLDEVVVTGTSAGTTRRQLGSYI